MGKVADRVNEKIVPIIESLGYEVVDVEYKKLYGDNHLIFYVHKSGGISLDDCETVSRAVSEPLDALDPTDGVPYHLDVSSPGLDRPIVSERDFARAVGTEVEIRLYVPVDKKKVFVGALVCANAGAITIENDGQKLSFERKNVALVRPHIRF